MTERKETNTGTKQSKATPSGYPALNNVVYGQLLQKMAEDMKRFNIPHQLSNEGGGVCLVVEGVFINDNNEVEVINGTMQS